jgi:hypothetical protein
MRFSFFPTIVSLLTLAALLGCAKAPNNPYSRENANISLSLMSSNYFQNDSAVVDTVGNPVRVNLGIHLADYIDSVAISIVSRSDVDTVIRYYKHGGYDTTITYIVSLFRTGDHIVTATGYAGGNLRQARAVIRIVGRPIPNRKPVLRASGADSVIAGRTITLALSASDPDSGQTVSIDTLRCGVSALFERDTLRWETTTADSGIDTLVFIARDNGPDSLTDTLRRAVMVISIAANRAPKWTADTAFRTVLVEKKFTLPLTGICADPDGNTVTFSLVPGTPGDHSVNDGIYTYTPSSTFTGMCIVRIAAVDPFGAADTGILKLAVVAVDNDTAAPLIRRTLPEKDSLNVDTSGFRVACLCKDTSGISTMRCLMGKDSFGVSWSDSVFTADISGLPSDSFGTIRFIAADGSTRANVCTLSIHIKGGCAEIASITVMDGVDSSAPRWTSATPAPTYNTSELVVCGDTAFIRVVTMTRMSAVKIDGIPLARSDSSGTVFEYRNMYLPIVGANVVKAEVTSLDLQKTKTYTLVVPSSLKPASMPMLLAAAPGGYRSLFVQCGSADDSRCKGIVILRAEHEMPTAELSRSFAPTEGTALAGDTSIKILKVLGTDGTSFLDDSLKPNSAYFYRAVTYGGTAGNFFFGAGRESSRSTTGKIAFTATVYVLATYVDDGSYSDWEMHGQIALCGKLMWDHANQHDYITVPQGTQTGQLGIAVQDTITPDNDSCMASFWLSDYDNISNDPIGGLNPTPIFYKEIAGEIPPMPGVYGFVSNKSFPLVGQSGSGFLTYMFTCEYVD